jgi:sporulation protein YlmC with PRC-barrel domain
MPDKEGRAMRLKLGTNVRCTDAPGGELADIVVDPVEKRVTHLVVRPSGPDEAGRLVPIELASTAAEGSTEILLSCTTAELAAFESSGEFAVLPLGEVPATGEDWDLGVEDAVSLPSFEAGEFGDYTGEMDSTIGVAYDRVPRGTVELRRSSAVESADGQLVGHVDAVLVDGTRITHVALQRGHLWWRRDVAIPIEAMATVQTDLVTASLSSEEIGALPATRP